MTIEAEVQQIMEQFRRNGFEIYIVGGYVRDYLLQQRNHDIDLATNARPEEIEALFPKTLS
ncbi:MAG: nucleotidyltransferase domain-containing protein, partial [Culicoidibacterales bacterium]